MTKRETKGQQVKTFTTHEPQEDMSYVATSVKVYFKDDEFTAYLPDHMHQVVENLPLFKEGRQTRSAYMQLRLSHAGDCISAKIVDHLVQGYKQILLEYFQHLTNLAAQKVIVVEFKANLPWRRERQDAGDWTFRSGGGTAVTRNDISFAGFPTVHLSYRILHRAGDTLYRRVEGNGDQPPRMEYVENPFLHAGTKDRGRIENRILDWTQEREDFFAETVARLTELGLRMHDFFKDTLTNTTYAIEQGRGQLALPPAVE